MLDGTPLISDRVLFTDTHDLETMLITSPAFAKLLDEYCNASRRGIDVDDIRRGLLRGGLFLGYVRWVSGSEEMGLDFDKINFRKMTRRGTTLELNSTMLSDVSAA